MIVLRAATLIDGTGAPPVIADVQIEGDRIVAIGPALVAPPGAVELDLRGTWLVPGLIDTHVHLMNVPGQPWLAPDPVESLRVAQLASFVACGVTTVLDVGTVPERMASVRAAIDAGAPAPTVYGLGEIVGPAGGYPSVFEPAMEGVGSVDALRALLDRNVSNGAIGTKVTFERGFGGAPLPLFDEGMRAAVRAESEARDLPVFVHAMTPEEFLPALELGPRAFLHGPERPDPAVTAAIAGSGAVVVPTLTVYDAPLLALDRRTLDDPWVRAVVPAELLAAGLDHPTAIRSRHALGEMVMPGAPDWAAGIGVTARAIARRKLSRAIAAARDLHEAGVPLALGTDSGTWPVIHTQFAGVAAVRELEYLAQAGLTPDQVLAAGTTTPAALLGLAHELGTVEIGKVADLVVLGSDPLRDPLAWRTTKWVVHDGSVRTPAEWMAVGGSTLPPGDGRR
ncbi:MAG: amidohydrolase family protein [Myxococcota bacterium]